MTKELKEITTEEELNSIQDDKFIVKYGTPAFYWLYELQHSEEIIEQSRWSTYKELVIKRDDGLFFRYYRSFGSTEMQEDDKHDVTVERVYEYEVKVKKFMSEDEIDDYRIEHCLDENDEPEQCSICCYEIDNCKCLEYKLR